MIVITGAAGFLGGSMVRHLNESGRSDLVLVADYPVMPVETCHGASLQGDGASLQGLRYVEKIPRDCFFDWLALNLQKVDFIIHLGSEIDTLPADPTCFQEQILEFSQRLWSFAAMNRIPLLFAAESTEAKWHWTGHKWIEWGCGAGPAAPANQLEKSIPAVQLVSTPQSTMECRVAEAERLKRQFDQWVLKQRVMPPLWAGFAMPEVYGPHEERLGNAASTVCQLFRQWQKEGCMLIPFYEYSENTDREPLMDRIFVKDVATVFTWFIHHLPASGFYFLGTGYPRPLSAVATAIFSALKQPVNVRYSTLPIPAVNLQQSENQLVLSRLGTVGYKKKMTPLETGIRLSVKTFLEK
ncbi:MAG: hypothetical protein J5644_08305 [Bacteroidales bacterium]|nr:hypothetical protein [Bacteroidales bacterium]